MPQLPMKYGLHSTTKDPRWFNSKPWHKGPFAIDETGRKVTIMETVLVLEDGQALPPGTLVNVGIDRNFYCETVADRGCYQQEQQRKLEEARAREEAKQAEIRRDAEAFNAAVKLPFHWKPGYKVMLSGVTERSNGDGIFRNTVNHIMLDEDISLGRLKRRKSEFLCGPSPVGRRTVDRAAAVRMGAGDAYPAKVSCKRCLEIAKRLNQ